jgi:hypothetical protein
VPWHGAGGLSFQVGGSSDGRRVGIAILGAEFRLTGIETCSIAKSAGESAEHCMEA